MENNHTIMDIFGTNVFNDKAMRQYLPKSIYHELRKTIDGRKELAVLRDGYELGGVFFGGRRAYGHLLNAADERFFGG